MNGVQCTFTCANNRYQSTKEEEGQKKEGGGTMVAEREEIMIHSPVFCGEHDSPLPRVLELVDGDAVSSVTVRYGALVDQLKFKTRKGKEMVAGGTGGGNETQV